MITFRTTPQVPSGQFTSHTLTYSWSGRVLTVTMSRKVVDPQTGVESVEIVASEDFDFSLLGSNAEADITLTVLPVNPIVHAETDASGNLIVLAVNWYDPSGQALAPTEEVMNG